MKINRLFIILDDIGAISAKDYLSFTEKLVLLLDYLSVILKRFCDGRFFNIFNIKRQRIGKYTLIINNYQDFYWTFREIFIHGDYYFKTNKKDPLIIDGGSNIGVGILFYKTIYPEAKIIAFEAHPDNFKLLKETVELNKLKNVDIINKAVSGEKGSINLYGSNRASTIVEDFSNMKVKRGDRSKVSAVIDVVPASDYVNEEIDFFKIDIEGSEGSVIKNLNESGKLRKINYLAVEYHNFGGDKNKVSDIVKILEDNNFNIYMSSKDDPTAVLNRDIFMFMLYAKRK
jgi:FkbM family methyltransferase